MDEASTQIGTLDRRMASWQTATRVSRRTSGAASGSSREPDPPGISPARWTGVALVFVALLSAMLLAATSPLPDPPDGPGSDVATTPSPEAGSPDPSTVPPGAGVPTERPIIVPPDASVTADPRLALVIAIPEYQLKPRDVRLHVFRDGAVVAKLRARNREVAVSGIKLRSGPNSLTAALVGPGGAGPPSEPVIVTLDDQPPDVRVAAPRDGQTLSTSDIVVRGTTEPGAMVTVTNSAGGSPYSQTAGPDGAFKASVRLSAGLNRITVKAEDELGNARTVRLSVTRAEFEASVRLRLSPPSMALASLPDSLTITLVVRDRKGAPVDGLDVRFTLGPSGPPTERYETRTKNGRAVWTKTIPRDGAVKGVGKVTATVFLPDGRKVVETADFAFD